MPEFVEISTAELSARYSGKAGLQQRLLPAYRAGFFDALARACLGGLSVFAGDPGAGEGIVTINDLEQASFKFARNWHFGRAESSYYLLWQRGLITWLDRWQPDALILEANPRYLASRRAIRWMHARRRPVIGWGLGSPPFSSKGLFTLVQQKFRRNFLLAFDALIAYSQRGAQEYRREGFPTEKIYIANNAVTNRPLEPYHERTPRPGEPLIVLFVGRLQARKRIDNLIRVCSNLPAAIQPHIWIVGDGPAREEFESFARDNYPQVRFFGGVHGPQLGSIFKEAHLFVLPGTGGLAVQEAMSYGLPVIVAKGDGTQDDLVRPENGWQVFPDDLIGLQEALSEALTDPERLFKMGRESYRIVSQEINLERMVAVFVEALNNTRII